MPTALFFYAKIEKKGTFSKREGENLGKGKKETESKVKIGAPSKYKKAYSQKMIDYFLSHVEQKAEGIPQFEMFALRELKVTPQTLINWRYSFKEFDEAYEVCKEIQKSYLISRGLTGANNPRMTQFVLSTCYKMTEYSRRKPEEEKHESGLSDGDRELLELIEKRLADKNEGGRPEFPEGVSFGESPLEEDEDG
jgi:hypothetical protein